jgi:hypothetical protein
MMAHTDWLLHHQSRLLHPLNGAAHNFLQSAQLILTAKFIVMLKINKAEYSFRKLQNISKGMML